MLACLAGLQEICECDKIGLHIVVRMIDAVAHAGLRGKMNDPIEGVSGKTFFYRSAIGEICPEKREIGICLTGGPRQAFQARFLKRRIIIGIDGIRTLPPRHRAQGAALQRESR